MRCKCNVSKPNTTIKSAVNIKSDYYFRISVIMADKPGSLMEQEEGPVIVITEEGAESNKYSDPDVDVERLEPAKTPHPPAATDTAIVLSGPVEDFKTGRLKQGQIFFHLSDKNSRKDISLNIKTRKDIKNSSVEIRCVLKFSK